MSDTVQRELDTDEFAAAMARQATMGGSAAKFAELLAEQEKAAEPVRELSQEALARQELFTRNGVQLGSLLVEGSDRLFERYKKYWTLTDPPAREPRDLLHVFGPDVTGKKQEFFYRQRWASIDGSGAGIGASADPTTGMFSAEQYRTGSNQADSYGGVGVSFRPRSHLCALSVRPIVQWHGLSIVAHRKYDPDVSAEAWAQSYGAIGVHVQSRSAPGQPIHQDAGRWVSMWNRFERNPSGTSYYDGTEGPTTIGLEGVFATDGREVMVWVSCRAFVMSQSVFNLDTRASASIGCFLPYLVVQETPLP